MKVIQLIDSLDAGGAERVAVNIANALALKTEGSFLCTTRKEGILKNSLNDDVGYMFLKKVNALDIFAIKRLSKFVRKHKIDVIHAHSTSFFLATIVKWLHPTLRIVWHDHYGNSEYLNSRKSNILKFCSKYISHIICVNDALKLWNKKKLQCNNVIYLPNFAVQDKVDAKTKLKGVSGKRILHLANLRPQKDHKTLFLAFKKVLEKFPDWSLHCVGKDFSDEYSKKIRLVISKLQLVDSVFFYDSKEDVSNIISQSDIGVLSSKSEGLPISLLEYGLFGLPVIATNVGDCKKVITIESESGILVEKENPKALASAIKTVISDKTKARLLGNNLKLRITNEFSEKAYIKSLLDIYRQKSEKG
ncbi:glycosyltransferase [Pontimicrobium sp. SW4]|uniref:Glycosyltransferase n=1 Tax=Pontimicrobium sp. SW4 TaxID=3153519 RepID=A0AAU7BUS6_9FLAO